MRVAAGAFASGLLFGIGLILSGMTDPEKVLAFLDLAGRWAPHLLLVMGGAVIVHGVSWQLIKKRPSPLLDLRFHLPEKTQVDAPLLTGSALFGIGWGLGGYCPGPALIAAAAARTDALAFTGFMLFGMALAGALERRASAPVASQECA